MHKLKLKNKKWTNTAVYSLQHIYRSIKKKLVHTYVKIIWVDPTRMRATIRIRGRVWGQFRNTVFQVFDRTKKPVIRVDKQAHWLTHQKKWNKKKEKQYIQSNYFIFTHSYEFKLFINLSHSLFHSCVSLTHTLVHSLISLTHTFSFMCLDISDYHRKA